MHDTGIEIEKPMLFHVGGIPSVPQHLQFTSFTLGMTRGMPVSEVTNYRLDDRSSVPGKANNRSLSTPFVSLVRHNPQSTISNPRKKSSRE